jgi:acetyl esterase/lipase
MNARAAVLAVAMLVGSASADELAVFRRIGPEMTPEQVIALCGKPKEAIGSGLYVFQYELADGSTVTVRMDGKRVLSVKHGEDDLLPTPIWPGTPPDAQPAAGPEVTALTKKNELVAGKPWTYVSHVSTPTITVYPAKGKNTGAAVLVFPGGGYQILAVDLEGTEVCDWLTAKGIACVLLKYRVPDTGPHWDAKLKRHVVPKEPRALEDAQRALGLVRLHAARWRIDPHKIGVLGFSAGGHLVADISTHFKERAYPAVDAADKESCRPDFGVALYPGHLSLDPRIHELNPDIKVTKDTPPTFILQAEDDPVDRVEHSLVYYAALRKAGVPVEMHLYAHEGHAFGLRRTKQPITAWPELVETWLTTIGMIPER